MFPGKQYYYWVLQVKGRLAVMPEMATGERKKDQATKSNTEKEREHIHTLIHFYICIELLSVLLLSLPDLISFLLPGEQ